MKIITTWHCTEILEGEEHRRPPRHWLILAGPGEDAIFELKEALAANFAKLPTLVRR